MSRTPVDFGKPGQVAASRTAAGLPPLQSTPAAPAAQPGPEIVIGDPKLVRPSVLLQGASGTGKTYQLRTLLEAGLNFAILAAEPKIQQLLVYKPMVIWIGEPKSIGGGRFRAATHQEKYMDLLRFKEKLAAGGYRTHAGRPVEGIAIDGVMEVSSLIGDHKKKTYDRSRSLIMWDEIGRDTVDFLRGVRDAAGMASGQMGMQPLSIIATCGEGETVDQLGVRSWQPILMGNVAKIALPFQFEAILRLTTRSTDGLTEYIGETARGDQSYAKFPDDARFPQEIANPNLAQIYGDLKAYYTKEVKSGGGA